MHDIRFIREQPDAFDAGLKRRGFAPMAAQLLEIDKRRREAVTRAQELQTRRNELSKLVGQKKSKGEDASAEMAEVAKSKDAQAEAEAQGKSAGDELTALLATIPNLPADDVPDGADENDNKELRKVGTPRTFDFKPRDHIEIGTGLGLMDFERAAKMSGARFVILSGALARLERALGAFMLDQHTGSYGYTEVSPPVLVREKALYGTGQLPKFEQDLFECILEYQRAKSEYDIRHAIFTAKRLNEKELEEILQKLNTRMRSAIGRGVDVSWSAGSFRDLAKIFADYKDSFDDFGKEFETFKNRFNEIVSAGGGRGFLIPTAEVSLTNIVNDEIVADETLPRRYTAQTLCFRSEAGAAGKDTQGMIRQHQFLKVEMVSIVRPEDSDAEHERMTSCAEEVLKRLGLPFRTVALCTGDMGFSARKTYDIEVWLPGQDRYREISSCSNCADFQARRMNARYRPAGEKGTKFVHTLNGSGLAVGRTLIAVLENYQQADGSVSVPEALRPYMGGLEVITPSK